MKFTLYPIHWLASVWVDASFDLGKLPFEVLEDVHIESVSERFRPGEFHPFRDDLGGEVLTVLEDVRYGIVHRYDPDSSAQLHCGGVGDVVGHEDHKRRSEQLVRELAACLRLIRPMRQHALLMRGDVRAEDGSFDVIGFDIPTLHIQEVPEVQKLFMLRNQDADALRALAPEFLRGIRGNSWKFKMAVQFHELGHFQPLDWKARFLLWCSAIESIYTSQNREHKGSLVAKSRINAFIGCNTSIYAPGDIGSGLSDPGITVGQTLDDLYKVRNCLAHGERVPDQYFRNILRYGVNGGVSQLEVLLEAASFILRSSLLKVVRDGLLEHFENAGSANAFWGDQGLTKSKLQAAQTN